MEFVCLILFLLMYFFRPQEWFQLLNSLHPVQLISGFAIYSIYKRDKGFKPSDAFKTPHDWLVFAYFAWTVYGSPTPWDTFKAIQSVILFYVICVQALSNIERIKKFLGWWALSLMLIAGLALGSEYGFDPFHSYDLTHGVMKDRLCLNLSIYNNPNGLGHSLVPVIPMVYLLFFWKRSIGKVTLALLVVPLWCIFLTQSKGAFLCAFVTILSTLTFGRPKVVQVVILCLAGIFGTAALYSLPRMNELDKTKGNEAIGGRIAAFKYGYQCMQNHTFGIGLGNFVPEFFRHGPMERYPTKRIVRGQLKRGFGYRHFYKATHSAYNQNGAELGYGGLTLFVGILYSCLRTLMTVKNCSVEEERVRRALFSVVISYVVSCWMVDFCYRPTFFLFVAATGAFHRIVRERSRSAEEIADEEEEQQAQALPAWRRRLQPALKPAAVPQALNAPASAAALAPAVSVVSSKALAAVPAAPIPIQAEPEKGPSPSRQRLKTSAPAAEVIDLEEPGGTLSWARLGLIDLALIALLTYGVIRVWLYSIEKF